MARRQVILITIDTLRADHLSSYGYARRTSPQIDRIASNSIVFRWAFSPISYTVPSHYSLMTGKYPSFHSVRFYNGRLPWKCSLEKTLAQFLQSQGFATAAFVSSSVLSLNLAPQIGNGFLEYDDTMTCHESTRPSELRRKAKETNEAALAWISKHKDEDFFCWIHYMDVHGPYESPEPYCDLFVAEIEGMPPRNLTMVPNGALGGIPEYQILNVRTEDGKVVAYETNYHYYLARYDGGIAYVDSAIGDLFRALLAMGIYDDLLLVITSDHGEALGENEVYFFHSLTVTMDQIHVPLVLKFPAMMGLSPRVIEIQVSLVDIAPTILDFFGLPPLDFSEEEGSLKDVLEEGSLGSQEPDGARPDFDLEASDRETGGTVLHGISLLPLIKGKSKATGDRRIVFSEIETQISAIDGEVQRLIGRKRPENPEYAFFHPDAPETGRTLKYRMAEEIDQARSDDRLTQAARLYLEVSQRISLEKISKLKASSEKAVDSDSQDEKGSDSESRGDNPPGEQSDDEKVLAHLRALGYA